MNVMSILCQRCGAPLQIADESVRFVTCAHCGTPLEIVREATQAHSRILEQIQAATSESAKTLKVIELQNDLERLDREWEAQGPIMDGVLVGTKKAHDQMLTIVATVIVAALLLIMGIMQTRPYLLAIAFAVGVGTWIVLLGVRKTNRDLKVLQCIIN